MLFVVLPLLWAQLLVAPAVGAVSVARQAPATQSSGVGTCMAACAVPTGYCKNVITYSACVAGSTSDPNIPGEAAMAANAQQYIATLAPAGGSVSAACQNEIAWFFCVFGVPACNSTTTTTYQKQCKSRCDTAASTCTTCATELKASGFFFDCSGEATTNCGTTLTAPPCLLSSASTATPAPQKSAAIRFLTSFQIALVLAVAMMCNV